MVRQLIGCRADRTMLKDRMPSCFDDSVSAGWLFGFACVLLGCLCYTPSNFVECVNQRHSALIVSFIDTSTSLVLPMRKRRVMRFHLHRLSPYLPLYTLDFLLVIASIRLWLRPPQTRRESWCMPYNRGILVSGHSSIA